MRPRQGLRRDQRGVGAVEFGLVAPVLLLGLMGVFDLGYDMYTMNLLEGAIQRAARDSTLQNATANVSSIDTTVRKVVEDIAPQATVEFKRTSYRGYSAVGKPEDFTDSNGNKTCDKGEPFEDMNNNGKWDTDQGKSSMGGARDVVLYKVTVTYPRPFAVAGLLGWSETGTMTAQTVLANQPWDNVAKTAPEGKCK